MIVNTFRRFASVQVKKGDRPFAYLFLNREELLTQNDLHPIQETS
jgi:hypothetical protein